MIFAMTKEQYIKITEPLRSNQERAKRVTSLNHMLTALVFCVYPLYLFMLFTDKNPWLWRAILVPAVSFVGLSVVRKIINAPRPYEKFDMPPVLEKDTKGKSFPSRHVFSIFLIGTTFYFCCPIPEIGILILILGVLLACLRVVSASGSRGTARNHWFASGHCARAGRSA